MPSTAALTLDQRAELADLLQARRAELVGERTAQLQGRSQVDAARLTLLQDADDASQRAGAHEVEASAGDLDSEAFRAVDEALLRVHGASYGVCIDCQVDIPFKRLLLEPQALRCADCQAAFERQARR